MAVGKVSVKVYPDTKGFARTTKRELEAQFARLKQKVTLDAEVSEPALVKNLLEAVRRVNAMARAGGPFALRVPVEVDEDGLQRAHGLLNQAGGGGAGVQRAAAGLVRQNELMRQIAAWQQRITGLAGREVEHRRRGRGLLDEAVSEKAVVGVRALGEGLRRLSGLRLGHVMGRRAWDGVANFDVALPRLLAFTGGLTAAASAATVLGGSLLAVGRDAGRIVAGVVALPGVFASAGVAVAGFVVGLRQMKEFAPEVGRAFEGLSKQMGARFWGEAGGLRDALTGLAPAVRAGMEEVSAASGAVAGLVASRVRAAVGPELQGLFRSVSDGLVAFAARGADGLAQSLRVLGRVGGEVFPALSRWAGDAASRLGSWLQVRWDDGSLTRWAFQAGRELRLLGQAGVESVRVLSRLGAAAETAGHTGLQGLVDGLQKIRGWLDTPANFEAVSGLFRGARESVSVFVREAQAGIGGFFRMVAGEAGRVGPAITSGLGAALGGLLEGVSGPRVRQAVRGFATQFQELGHIASGVFRQIGASVGVLEQLNTLIVPFGRIAGGAFGGVLAGVERLAPALGHLARNLVSAVEAAGPGIHRVFGGLLKGIDPVLRSVGSQLGSMFRQAAPQLESFGRSVGDVFLRIGRTLADHVSRIDLGGFFKQALSAAQPLVKILGSVASGFMKLASPFVTAGLKVIGGGLELIGAALEGIAPLVEAVSSGLGRLGEAAAGFLADVNKNMGEALVKTSALEEIGLSNKAAGGPGGVLHYGENIRRQLDGLQAAAARAGVAAQGVSQPWIDHLGRISGAAEREVAATQSALSRLGRGLLDSLQASAPALAEFWRKAAGGGAEGARLAEENGRRVGAAMDALSAELDKAGLRVEDFGGSYSKMLESVGSSDGFDGVKSSLQGLMQALDEAGVGYAEFLHMMQDGTLDRLGVSESAQAQILEMLAQFESLPTELRQKGAQAGEGFWGGVGSKSPLASKILEGASKDAVGRAGQVLQQGMQTAGRGAAQVLAQSISSQLNGGGLLQQAVGGLQRMLQSFDAKRMLGDFLRQGQKWKPGDVKPGLPSTGDGGGGMAAGIQAEAARVQQVLAGLTARVQVAMAGLRASVAAGFAGLTVGASAAVASLSSTVAAGMAGLTLRVQTAMAGVGASVQAGFAGVNVAASVAVAGLSATVAAGMAGVGLAVTAGMAGVGASVQAGFAGVNVVAAVAVAGLSATVSAGFAGAAAAAAAGTAGIVASVAAGMAGVSAAAAAGMAGFRVSVAAGMAGAAAAAAAGMAGVRAAVQAGAAGVAAAGLRMAAGMRAAAAGIVAAMSVARAGVASMAAAVASGCARAVGAARSAAAGIRGAFGGVSLAGAGARIMNSLIAGIRSRIGALYGLLASVTAAIPRYKGPPKRDAVLLFSAGQLIMGGLANGMIAGFDRQVKPALQHMTQDIAATRFDAPAIGFATKEIDSLAGRGPGSSSGGVHVAVTNKYPTPERKFDTVQHALSLARLLMK